MSNYVKCIPKKGLQIYLNPKNEKELAKRYKEINNK